MPWRPGVSKWQERQSGSEKGAVARRKAQWPGEGRSGPGRGTADGDQGRGSGRRTDPGRGDWPGLRGTAPRNYSPEYACRPLNQSEPE